MDRMALGPDDGAGQAEDDSGSQRRTRDSFFLMATLQIGDDPAVHDVRIRNLSEGGLMAEFERPVSTNMPVRIHIRGIGPIAGRVAWYVEGRIGVALDTPIDPKRARKPVGVGGGTPFYAKSALNR